MSVQIHLATYINRNPSPLTQIRNTPDGLSFPKGYVLKGQGQGPFLQHTGIRRLQVLQTQHPVSLDWLP